MPQGIATVEHLMKDGTPDWDAIDFDVLCGRCGYNLRTLTTPRCTECGLTFEWLVVLHRSGVRSEWLFEHNWRRAPMWSWCQTVCRAFWPRRFFKGLSLHDQVSPFALWVMLLSAVPVQVVFSRAAIERDADAIFATIASVGAIFLSLSLIAVLGQTLARCQVRSVHLLRVFAYSAPPIITWWMLIAMLLVSCGPILGGDDSVPEFVAPLVLLGACLLIFVLYVRAGFRHYVGLPHPGLAAAAAGIIGGLATLCGMVLYAVS